MFNETFFVFCPIDNEVDNNKNETNMDILFMFSLLNNCSYCYYLFLSNRFNNYLRMNRLYYFDNIILLVSIS